MFAIEYLPKIREEFERFTVQSRSKELVAVQISEIVGCSVGVYLGELKVAKPTNDLIDNLMKLFNEYEKVKNSR